MKEIEVKAQITNRGELERKLKDLGCVFSEPVVQKDRIFIPDGHDLPVENGVNVFRIREQNGKLILTLKQPVTNGLDCIERELGIDNEEEMAEMIKLLGFYECSAVSKSRVKCNYQDKEICLDSVEKLGDYIEVEILTEDGQADVVQKELFEFLETLGVAKEDQVFDGYDILLKKKGLL